MFKQKKAHHGPLKNCPDCGCDLTGAHWSNCPRCQREIDSGPGCRGCGACKCD